MLWLTENLATVLVLLIVSALVALVIVGMIRDKKRGKSVTCGACSGDCAHCRAAHAEAIRTARAAYAAKAGK